MLSTQTSFERKLAEYFQERLGETSQQLPPSPHEDTLWYLSTMLARFGRNRELFSEDESGTRLRPLALLYKDAQEASDPRHRCLILRQLGDIALFVGAFFPENYARRGIRKNYFVGMGSGAYEYLSDNAGQQRHVFSELARTFSRQLELLARVGISKESFDDSDILSLYQRWQETGDLLLADTLRSLGIDVNDHRVH